MQPTILPFEIRSAFTTASPVDANSFALRVMVLALAELDRGYLLRHPRAPRLYASGIVYHRTPSWMDYPSMLERGFADCKSLAAQIIAERALEGVTCEPAFRWLTRPDGMRDFHVLVECPGGIYEDPSKICGMGEYQRLHETGRE